MAQTETGPAPTTPRGDWRSGLVLVLAVLAVVHSLLVGLWLAPSGPVREAAGAGRLATYVDPYFRQSWDVLDPSAQRVDETFRVRTRVRVAADRVEETPWVDVTAGDVRALRGDATPARARLAARRLATNLNNAMFALGPAGRKRVQEPYTGTPVAELRGVLLASDAPPEAVSSYMDLDAMATRFATLHAQARLDERVVQVQYRVGRRTVPPRAERAEKQLEDVPWDWFDFGWRRAERGSAQAQAAFDDLVGEKR